MDKAFFRHAILCKLKSATFVCLYLILVFFHEHYKWTTQHGQNMGPKFSTAQL